MSSRFSLLVCVAIQGIALCLPALPSSAQFSTFDSRTKYTAVILQQGRVLLDEDFNETPPEEVSNHERLGDFIYTFDPARLRLAVVEDADADERRLGTLPSGRFRGDDLVTLCYTGLHPLTGFALEFLYDPSPDPIPPGVFGLRIEDGKGEGAFLGNPAGLPREGGRCFLGLIADPGYAFRKISLLSITPRGDTGEPTFLVPPYQVDDLAYAAVPEPGVSILAAAALLAGVGFAFQGRRGLLSNLFRHTPSAY